MPSKIEPVVRDRMISQFKELGLSTHETLTYVTLLSHPNITAGVLCKETGIPDSKIYYALDGLSDKGLIVVQKGNPNVYLPASPKDAVAGLIRRLSESLDEKIKEADVLVDMLTPIYESAEKSEELELAYIVQGQKNIINRMKALIDAARREVTIFVSYPAVLKALRDSLIEAREKRGVKLKVAITQEVLEKEDSSDLGEIRLLCCASEMIDSLGMVISDRKTLLTVSNWTGETALLTQDRNLIQVARDYFESPLCCTDIEKRR